MDGDNSHLFFHLRQCELDLEAVYPGQCVREDNSDGGDVLRIAAVQMYGEEYEHYRSEVGMFLPKL